METGRDAKEPNQFPITTNSKFSHAGSCSRNVGSIVIKYATFGELYYANTDRSYSSAIWVAGWPNAASIGDDTSGIGRAGGWRRFTSFFTLESRFKTFFDKTFANLRHRVHMTIKSLADLLIAQSLILRLIHRKQNMGVLDFLGVALACRNEFNACLTLFGCQCYLVYFLHFILPAPIKPIITDN